MVMKSYLSDKELQSLQTELHSSTWISLDNILLLTASVTYDCTGWAPHKEGIHRILGITDLVLISSVSSVQSLSRVWLFVTIWTTAHQASLSITNSQSLLKLMSVELVIPSNHLILCRPLLLLPSIFASIRVFSNESAVHIRWPKYWSFSFSISPSNEYSGLISFRMGWLDLLTVQGTFKSLLQHHSSKASILWCSGFFVVQLSHDYWKNHSFDYTDFCQQSNGSAL